MSRRKKRKNSSVDLISDHGVQHIDDNVNFTVLLLCSTVSMTLLALGALAYMLG